MVRENTKNLNERGSIPIIIGMVLVVAFAAGVGYTYFFADKNKQKIPVSENTQPEVTTAPLPSSQVSVSEFKNDPEDLKAINGDVKLSYFINPHDNQKIIYKQVDFKTNTSREIVLPYLSKYNSDDTKRGEYKVSPNAKYILKITRNLLEIAELSNPVFKTVFKVQPIRDPKWDKVGENLNQTLDFAHMDDAMWDKNGKLYFVTGVGIDGVGAPEGGVYSNLYVANENGDNVRLINDHTKENQRLGFMKDFAYIDVVKNEIYFSGSTHGGHLAALISVDANSGVQRRSFQDIYTDFVNPVFNKDFSKAYYEQDLKDEGYNMPVKIMEYDLNTKTKRNIYSVKGASEDYSSPQLDNYPSGALYLNQDQNILYFQIREGKTVHFYSMDVSTNAQPKLLFSEDRNCGRIGVSANGDYLLLNCNDTNVLVKEYQIYQVSTGKRSTFYKDKYSTSVSDSESFQFVSLD